MKVPILLLPLLTVAALLAIRLLWGPGMTSAASEGTSEQGTRFWVSTIVSTVVLGAGLYIILSRKYQPDDKNWAFAAVGTVVGYWLPSASLPA